MIGFLEEENKVQFFRILCFSRSVQKMQLLFIPTSCEWLFWQCFYAKTGERLDKQQLKKLNQFAVRYKKQESAVRQRKGEILRVCIFPAHFFPTGMVTIIAFFLSVFLLTLLAKRKKNDFSSFRMFTQSITNKYFE